MQNDTEIIAAGNIKFQQKMRQFKFEVALDELGG